jgi:hypothetical protein
MKATLHAGTKYYSFEVVGETPVTLNEDTEVELLEADDYWSFYNLNGSIVGVRPTDEYLTKNLDPADSSWYGV